MGKSLRSKPMRKNRARTRARYEPRETEKLKAALAYEYNEENEKAHLSIFHNIMNGPPPKVVGLEPGSGVERAHLTVKEDMAEKIDSVMKRRRTSAIDSAVRAVTKGAVRSTPIWHPKDEKNEKKQALIDKRKGPVSDEPRVHDPKTFKDQFGQYPVWFNKKKLISKARRERLDRVKAKRTARRKAGQSKRKAKNSDFEIVNKAYHQDAMEVA